MISILKFDNLQAHAFSKLLKCALSLAVPYLFIANEFDLQCIAIFR